jgi:4-diphosphocytidyl-2-C-methyl-D-erythritol kinase
MRILSPAKINLFLQITGKRPDGYHDLVSLMCCVGLYDTISLTFGVKETSVSCRHPEVPVDETNLAVAAASLFFKTLNKNESVKISIEKQIPVGAGLGGGSSNAAAVFLGLNRYYSYPFSPDKLISMGRSIGADVPFFIFRKPAIVSGIGDKFNAYQQLESFKILLVFPGFGISTAKVYKNLNLGLTKCKKKLRSFLLNKQSFDPRCHLCNDLEPIAASMYPGIVTVKEALLRHGALGALMSGSGSTVFGLFPDSDKALKAKDGLAENDKWQLYLVDMMTKEDVLEKSHRDNLS